MIRKSCVSNLHLRLVVEECLFRPWEATIMEIRPGREQSQITNTGNIELSIGTNMLSKMGMECFGFPADNE